MREVIAGLFGVSMCCLAAAGEPERDAFLRDYKPSQALVAAFDLGFEFEMRQNDEPRPKVSKVTRSRGLFTNAGFAIFSQLRKVPKTNIHYQNVELGNADYDAFLDVTPTDEYVVKMLNTRKPGRGPQLLFLAGPMCELQVDYPFAEAVRRPDVTVESYGDATWQGRQVKALRLALNAQYGQRIVPERNDYYFSPGDDWLCVGYRERGQSVLREEVYKETVYTFPADRSQSAFLPDKVEDFEVDERKDQRRRTRVSEVTEVVPRKVAEAEVRLSGYGLPEPEGVAWSRPTPPWVWLVVAGIAVGAIVFGVRLAWGRAGPAAPVAREVPRADSP